MQRWARQDVSVLLTLLYNCKHLYMPFCFSVGNCVPPSLSPLTFSAPWCPSVSQSTWETQEWDSQNLALEFEDLQQVHTCSQASCDLASPVVPCGTTAVGMVLISSTNVLSKRSLYSNGQNIKTGGSMPHISDGMHHMIRATVSHYKCKKKKKPNSSLHFLLLST